jgi:hypothetical protein
MGPGLESGAGLALPPAGEQRVEWLEVVQVREPAPSEHVYTIAAMTDATGLLYMTVGVERRTDGALALTGYPAFIGPPASVPAQVQTHLRTVNDAAAATVVTRALGNYLSGASADLAADLSAGARVSLPSLRLTLQSVQGISWTPDGRSVIAVVQARDGRGTQYTLGYELDLQRRQGRWEISAVQMDPYA